MPNDVCFVVMGFGKKTDYGDNPRTLDLDATYQSIIKPAVEAAGMTCVRADEIAHSGVIDQKMFEMLLRADLVIADISTANPNALYELGVRHALRPLSTIIIKEQDGKFLFDLNHMATLQYKHLGEDIGSREAATKKAQLQALIGEVRRKKEHDSPVYTFLRDLREPGMASMSDVQFKSAMSGVRSVADTVSMVLDEARKAARESRHADAAEQFRKAYDMYMAMHGDAAQAADANKMDPFIVQQLALHTYKSKLPTPVEALRKGWEILGALRPESSSDPETLGIAGAIQKRLWSELRERSHLELAIELYGRGFEVMRDYYNGVNYATCLDARAAAQADPAEASYDRMAARKVRERVVAGLRRDLAEPTAGDRRDYKWMLATIAGALYGLGDPTAADYEAKFRATNPAKWELETFEQGKAAAGANVGVKPSSAIGM